MHAMTNAPHLFNLYSRPDNLNQSQESKFLSLEHTPFEHTPLEHTRPHILLYKASIPLISKAKMNTLINQTLWANSLNVDEVVPWEVKNLCNLMNAIFSEAIDNQVNKLRKEKCCGCKIQDSRFNLINTFPQ